MAVLQTIHQDPDAYVTWEAVSNMIVATHTQMLNACVEVELSKEMEGPGADGQGWSIYQSRLIRCSSLLGSHR